MSKSESKPKPEAVSVEETGILYPQRISSLFMVGGFACAAGLTGIVVLVALTSWWVLLALFALPALMMMVGGPLMMTTMRDPTSNSFWARWCAPWLRSDAGRTTSDD